MRLASLFRHSHTLLLSALVRSVLLDVGHFSSFSLCVRLCCHRYPCLCLHGGMDQYDRDNTITDFKNGMRRVLVATSVAGRGLDVKDLTLVVNYNCPNHLEDYVHRVGRTGRAGRKGNATAVL